MLPDMPQTQRGKRKCIPKLLRIMHRKYQHWLQEKTLIIKSYICRVFHRAQGASMCIISFVLHRRPVRQVVYLTLLYQGPNQASERTNDSPDILLLGSSTLGLETSLFLWLQWRDPQGLPDRHETHNRKARQTRVRSQSSPEPIFLECTLADVGGAVCNWMSCLEGLKLRTPFFLLGLRTNFPPPPILSPPWLGEPSPPRGREESSWGRQLPCKKWLSKCQQPAASQSLGVRGQERAQWLRVWGEGPPGISGMQEALNPGTRVSCLGLLYPSSLCKSQTPLTSKTGDGD